MFKAPRSSKISSFDRKPCTHSRLLFATDGFRTLQPLLLSNPTVSVCRYCGRFFIPKTKKKTLYCDRIIRNGKTCKQIAPYLTHKERVTANKVSLEYERVKDLLLHRLDRAGYRKKRSPIDLTYMEYCQWLDAAKDAETVSSPENSPRKNPCKSSKSQPSKNHSAPIQRNRRR